MFVSHCFSSGDASCGILTVAVKGECGDLCDSIHPSVGRSGAEGYR